MQRRQLWRYDRKTGVDLHTAWNLLNCLDCSTPDQYPSDRRCSGHANTQSDSLVPEWLNGGQRQRRRPAEYQQLLHWYPERKN